MFPFLRVFVKAQFPFSAACYHVVHGGYLSHLFALAVFLSLYEVLLQVFEGKHPSPFKDCHIPLIGCSLACNHIIKLALTFHMKQPRIISEENLL